MDRQQISESLQHTLRHTGSYSDLPNYPECVESLQSLEAMIQWLGETDFTPTHSGTHTACQQLVRVANTLKYGEALAMFATWMASLSLTWTPTQDSNLSQEALKQLMEQVVARDCQRIRVLLKSGEKQHAYELAGSLAAHVAKDVPTYRASLARFVLTLL